MGFRAQRDTVFLERNRRLRRLHPEIVERTQATIASQGGEVWRDPKTDLLHLNNELVICLVLARSEKSANGMQRWRILFDPAHYAPDITVAIRLDASNERELDYYLLPLLDLPQQELNVNERSIASYACFRFDNLDFFYGLSHRERVQRHA